MCNAFYKFSSFAVCSVEMEKLKLVSHWHANSSRLLREFSRENFHVSRTGREGFKHV